MSISNAQVNARLAMHAARGLMEHFSSGVWLIELSTIFSEEQILREKPAMKCLKQSASMPAIN